MAVPTDITAGTLTITNGSTAVTGSGTAWLASDLRQGDIILWIEGGDGFQTPILAGVPASNSALTLAEPWPGPTLTNVRYRIRYQWDSSRVSAQSRQLIEVLDNGNILALASLTGPGVPVFDGPHSMVIKPEADFINGVAYDVQVDTLADRAAYDGQTAGFSVLVSDVGDGRSALYSKNSNTSGDWSDPAYITGPLGPTPDIEATVSNTAPGTTPTVTPVPITGGTRLDFTLPEAEGFNNTGPYNPANAYVRNDVVTSNGSTFIALQAVPPGTTPSGATPPVDTAYWQVLAVRGLNGTGTGDVVGPSGAVNNAIAGFDGTTGKLIKGLTSAQATSYLALFTTAKGLVPGATSGDVSAGRILSAAGVWIDAPNPAPLSGTVVNSWFSAYTSYFSGSAIVPVDDTPPLATEGVSIISISTGVLKSATNKLRIRFSGLVGADVVTSAILSVHIGSNPAVRTSFGVIRAAGDLLFMGGEYEYSPGATTSVTVNVRAGTQAGNLRLNGLTSRLFGGASGVSLVVEEIAA